MVPSGAGSATAIMNHYACTRERESVVRLLTLTARTASLRRESTSLGGLFVRVCAGSARR